MCEVCARDLTSHGTFCGKKQSAHKLLLLAYDNQAIQRLGTTVLSMSLLLRIAKQGTMFTTKRSSQLSLPPVINADPRRNQEYSIASGSYSSPLSSLVREARETESSTSGLGYLLTYPTA